MTFLHYKEIKYKNELVKNIYTLNLNTKNGQRLIFRIKDEFWGLKNNL
jgi:hypothetical protein